jgi:hypothetical protein
LFAHGRIEYSQAALRTTAVAWNQETTVCVGLRSFRRAGRMNMADREKRAGRMNVT